MSEISLPRGPGRPPAEIDEQLLERFLSVRMPLKQIARYFSVSEMTLWNRYRDLINQSYALYDFSVRAKQLEMAENGSEKMLMFLGKTTIEDRQTENAPIPVMMEEQGVEFTVITPPAPASYEEDEE